MQLETHSFTRSSPNPFSLVCSYFGRYLVEMVVSNTDCLKFNLLHEYTIIHSHTQPLNHSHRHTDTHTHTHTHTLNHSLVIEENLTPNLPGILVRLLWARLTDWSLTSFIRKNTASGNFLRSHASRLSSHVDFASSQRWAILADCSAIVYVQLELVGGGRDSEEKGKGRAKEKERWEEGKEGEAGQRSSLVEETNG